MSHYSILIYSFQALIGGRFTNAKKQTLWIEKLKMLTGWYWYPTYNIVLPVRPSFVLIILNKLSLKINVTAAVSLVISKLKAKKAVRWINIFLAPEINILIDWVGEWKLDNFVGCVIGKIIEEVKDGLSGSNILVFVLYIISLYLNCCLMKRSMQSKLFCTYLNIYLKNQESQHTQGWCDNCISFWGTT